MGFKLVTPYIIAFDNCKPEEYERVGGKCSSLAALTQKGIAVPPGFAITTDAYAEFLAAGGLKEKIQAVLDSFDNESQQQGEKISASIRELIEANGLPAHIEASIKEAYKQLSEQVGVADLPVAVRSSATAEDLPDASFAGQQDTYLWVVGEEALIEHTLKCWSSLFTARAISYRQDKGFADDEILMSVAVQKMVNARSAGVAMTLNPINGDRTKVVIDSSWGLGELVVSGEVTPDNFVMDKVILEIVHETIFPKTIELVANPEARQAEMRDVEAERQTLPSLSRDELQELAKLAKQVEQFYGQPQDIEWAIDNDVNQFFILQSRPETVWSQKKAVPKKAYKTGMDGILSTLLKPTKPKIDTELKTEQKT